MNENNEYQSRDKLSDKNKNKISFEKGFRLQDSEQLSWEFHLEGIVCFM